MKYLCIPEYALRSVAIEFSPEEVSPATIECSCTGLRIMDIIEGEVVTDEEYRDERTLPADPFGVLSAGT